MSGKLTVFKPQVHCQIIYLKKALNQSYSFLFREHNSKHIKKVLLSEEVLESYKLEKLNELNDYK